MRKLLTVLISLAAMFLGANAAVAQNPTSLSCSGKFVNPITDVCWSCMFPLSIGGMKVWPSKRPDPKNPTLPVCACGSPVPRIGVAVGFWEPVRLVDVTTKPWCFPNLGGLKLDAGFNIGLGKMNGPRSNGKQDQQTATVHSHYYVYPLLYWMEILTDFLCLEQSTFDVAYITELDPLWQDSELSGLIHPEVALFANPIAKAACAADCVKSTAHLPIDQMFWCAGCNGSMYPMNGQLNASYGHPQVSRLVAERMLFKMHRQALAWGTMGSKSLCHKYIMPVMRKQQYRLQMVNPISTTSGVQACGPIGMSTLNPQTGRAFPVKGEDMGYLVWRKRNCCML